MIPEDAERVLDLFAEARACAPEQRATFLTQACVGNDAVRAEIESLLSGQAPSPDFLAQPAFGRGLEVLGDAELYGELKAGDTVGDCQIRSLLGVGGMGEVYLADDVVLGRRVALKLIQRGKGGTLLSHFRHERRVLAGLTHPNIARLYGGAVTPEGRAYLVMEYVEGERLDRYCVARALPLAERLTLFRKICAAVSYAHQNLVIHRDLKPANIRVTAEGEPKLLDFGIAKLLQPEGTPSMEVTATMSGALTPEYASPEQLRGEPITTASDVYSLGVVLYELLCGERPYRLKGRRPDELARVICEEDPPRASTVAGRGPTANPTGLTTDVTAGLGTVGGEAPARLRRRLEGDLDNIVAMALRKEPIRRYTSVAQFSDDIRCHCDGLPVIARPATLSYRASKFVSRNKVGVAAAAIILLALIGGLAATTWQAHVADQERDRARLAQTRAETSRQFAEAARKQSETARKQTQRINEFLQTLLGSANPAKLGKDVKVSEVLDAASASVDTELANEPEVLAQVHQTLGQTYVDIGMNGLAAKQFQPALTTFHRLYGDEDPRTVGVEHQLAISLNRTGVFTGSEPLLRHEVASLQRRIPEDNAKLAPALSALGFCLSQTHRFIESESVLNEAFVRTAKASGANSAASAAILNQLGVLKRAEGNAATGAEAREDGEAAADFLRRSLAILDRVAPDRPNEVVIRLNLCFVCLDQHQLAEAETQLERVNRDRVRIFGEVENLYAAEALMVADSIKFGRGDFAGVAAEGSKVVDRYAMISPGDDEASSNGRFMLGVSLTRIGRATEGEPLLREALAHHDAADSIYSYVYGNVETALGDCLFAQKRYTDAEPLLLIGYGELKTHLSAHNTLTVQAAERVNALYLAWHKSAKTVSSF